MMLTTTGSTGLGQKPLTLDDILDAMEKIKKMPRPLKEWIVISPDGRMYRGEAQDVIRPLIEAHPLMKPFSPLDMSSNALAQGRGD